MTCKGFTTGGGSPFSPVLLSLVGSPKPGGQPQANRPCHGLPSLKNNYVAAFVQDGVHGELRLPGVLKDAAPYLSCCSKLGLDGWMDLGTGFDGEGDMDGETRVDCRTQMHKHT